MVSDEGKIAGIGVVFGRSDDQADPAMYILKLHPNGPAARIGLLGPMQELISVNGWNVHGQDIPSVMQRVKGQAGTKVTLEELTYYFPSPSISCSSWSKGEL